MEKLFSLIIKYIDKINIKNKLISPISGPAIKLKGIKAIKYIENFFNIEIYYDLYITILT